MTEETVEPIAVDSSLDVISGNSTNALVGHSYVEGVTRWQEHAELFVGAGVREITIFLDNPGEREIMDVAKGKWKLDLYKENTAIFLCFRFGSVVGITNFNINMVPEDHLVPPDPTLNSTTFYAILVNAKDGMVLANRKIETSPRFAGVLDRLVMSQLDDDEFNEADHRRHVMNVRKRHGYKSMCEMAFIRDRSR